MRQIDAADDLARRQQRQPGLVIGDHDASFRRGEFEYRRDARRQKMARQVQDLRAGMGLRKDRLLRGAHPRHEHHVAVEQDRMHHRAIQLGQDMMRRRPVDLVRTLLLAHIEELVKRPRNDLAVAVEFQPATFQRHRIGECVVRGEDIVDDGVIAAPRGHETLFIGCEWSNIVDRFYSGKLHDTQSLLASETRVYRTHGTLNRTATSNQNRWSQDHQEET